MKQRLVGILVLGCLAVIIIPVLLDGDGIQPQPLSTVIPPEPVFPATTIAEPVRPAIIADTLPDADAVAAQDDAAATETPAPANNAAADADLPAFVAEESVAAPAAEPATDTPDALEAAVAAILAESGNSSGATADATPRLDSSGLPAAFVVRLASFGEKANADTLVEQLLDAEYKAYARTVSTANGVFSAVYVGPVITRAEANDLLDKLSKRFKLNGIVENFTMQPLP